MLRATADPLTVGRLIGDLHRQQVTNGCELRPSQVLYNQPRIEVASDNLRTFHTTAPSPSPPLKKPPPEPALAPPNSTTTNNQSSASPTGYAT
ncbi:hypothetical protein Tsubulata_016731 [Turnera subulata]|uniref:Uncharacterized protein n=1 Tax=Turnera subulata TaxID=218843 RepID=A0A9Q0G9I4_9ROSI|nr:hypothetical protein Tsubulata_016731 [Turnera subulata]